MGSFFPGGDIMDFLVCLGKPPTRNLKKAALDFDRPVFVEDTDPNLAKAVIVRGFPGTASTPQNGNGWGTDETETVPLHGSGWGTPRMASAPKNDDGWGTHGMASSPKNDDGWGKSAMVSAPKNDDGWGTSGMASAPKNDDGWGTSGMASAPKNDDGWGNTAIVSAPKNDEGWSNPGMELAPKNNDGWGTDGTQTPSQHNDGWGTFETEASPQRDNPWNIGRNFERGSNNVQKNVPKQRTHETGHDNATAIIEKGNESDSEPMMIWGDTEIRSNEDVNEGHFMNMRRSGKFAPSGSNAIPLGRRRDISHTDSSSIPAGSQDSSKKYPVKKVHISEGAVADLSTKGTYKGGRSMHGREKWKRNLVKERLATTDYPEMSELQNLCKKILHYSEYKNGDQLNAQDQKFVLEKVFVHHPDKDAKVGCGVEYVVIDKHPDHDATCFFLVRKDGSKADFSYWKCLEKILKSRYPGRDWGTKAPDNALQKDSSDGGAWYEASKDIISNESEKQQHTESGGSGW